MAREAIRESHPDLADMVNELVPFETDFLSILTPSIDETDLHEWGQYNYKTLQERYNHANETIARAHAQLDPEIAHWQASIRAKATLRMSTSLTERLPQDASISQLEQQIEAMKQNTDQINKHLKGCTKKETIEKLNADFFKLSDQMKQQVSLLKRQISSLTSEKNTQIVMLKADSESKIVQIKESLLVLETKPD